MLTTIRRLFTRPPCPLALDMAAQREATAERLAGLAAARPYSLDGVRLADEARQWRDAAQRARRGDLSPIKLT